MWKLLEKLSEITQFSRFFPSSNSVFDLRSSSSTTVYSISLSSTLIFVCFHMAQPLTIQLTDDVPNSLDWLKFLLDEDTKTHPLQALSAEFSIIVWFAAVIAQGENTKTKPIHAPSSGFPVSEFGIIILFADVRAQVWLKSVQSSTCKCKCTRVRMGPSSSMAALLPLPSLSLERQSSSYFAFVEEAILVHGRDFSVLWLVKCVWGNSFSSI